MYISDIIDYWSKLYSPLWNCTVLYEMSSRDVIHCDTSTHTIYRCGKGGYRNEIIFVYRLVGPRDGNLSSRCCRVTRYSDVISGLKLQHRWDSDIWWRLATKCQYGICLSHWIKQKTAICAFLSYWNKLLYIYVDTDQMRWNPEIK